MIKAPSDRSFCIFRINCRGSCGTDTQRGSVLFAGGYSGSGLDKISSRSRCRTVRFHRGGEVLKKVKHTCLALLLMVIAYEIMTFAYSVTAEHKANAITQLVTSLKPGHTTMDEAKALFHAHGVNVEIKDNACGIPTCAGLYLLAVNFPRGVIPVHIGEGLDVVVKPIPLPPVKTAGFVANLYFINGILNSISAAYTVGTTGVGYSWNAGEHNVRSSEWKYANGGLVTSIGVASSGAAFDIPFPRFAFNYMYSAKCVDARMLWPTAPPPTTELQGWPGCR